MNTEINKTKWKCRRGLRELDLLFRKFSNNHLESLSKQDFDMFNSILDIEDQPIYDFIFKGVSLGNKPQEDFILQRIKKFLD
ncbi:succinate dehydrogenase assembly factor 2 [Gammaproteobacteria bacterium]|jgi:antitoxin CptB|nr:succinate dehydrogenase assembly factor 2 [Gammaproteobacteria bacterium]MDA9610370.1 succinate dehydrogenase assembly factor 2 [Pseudomonadota bacterium]MDB3877847.1 succinate dehydrogenase assembly factor 2 [Gammaproteobacteria bacterium]MDB4243428.1 succinate dehydrogenase assembly factor 2 [Gammaproteobacteria bacterium]MDB9907648.1 succinate dehydrogenase assembly factor 2 [Gammaproteobacteria bacterium]